MTAEVALLTILQEVDRDLSVGNADIARFKALFLVEVHPCQGIGERLY